MAINYYLVEIIILLKGNREESKETKTETEKEVKGKVLKKFYPP